MAIIGAWVFAAGTALTALFHLALILGAPWGHLTMGGRWRGPLPAAARVLSAVSAGLLLAMAALVLRRAEVWGEGAPSGLPALAFWAVPVFMALSIVMHIATPSRSERRLWLPVILVMSAGVLAVALD